MNSDLQNLIELQKVDREIARLTAEIASLPKRVAAIEEKLRSSRERMEAAKGVLKADEQARRKYEGEIQSLQQKISKYREQQLAVKTNQEYKALTHEVEFSEQQIRNFEDKILEIMLDAEDKERIVKQTEGELRTHTAAIEKEKTEARARTAEDEKLLADFKAQRESLRSATDSDALRHYDRVLKLRGSAIAEAINHRCSACQVMLRPQIYNDVQSNQHLLTCDSCNRILFYDPSHEPEAVSEQGAVAEKPVSNNLPAH
ncbi:MAG TPA: C4-type zinc ribbon domain-containing protein [Terriglobales bacterium]|nr:C4-type zinc ribbon domain-containing protein [Terriglobales bacterium]